MKYIWITSFIKCINQSLTKNRETPIRPVPVPLLSPFPFPIYQNRIRPAFLYEGRGEFPSIWHTRRLDGEGSWKKTISLLFLACPACRHARDDRGAGECGARRQNRLTCRKPTKRASHRTCGARFFLQTLRHHVSGSARLVYLPRNCDDTGITGGMGFQPTAVR